MSLVYGSVCSGIESASVAWAPLGWQCAFMSEIDKFPRAVLAHRFPEVPLHGDFTTIREGEYRPIDLLVGGTPCQDFSVAGKRAGLRGARGNLTLEYCLLAERLRPTWFCWENVPGVLSSNGGRDFGAFLGLLAELGYGFAWRVLDAQYVLVDGYARAVPQRRERVFLVGYLGDWRPPAAALLEPEGMCGHPAPRREAGKGHPGAVAFCSGGGRQGSGLDVAACLAAHGTRLDWEVETFVAEPVACDVAQTLPVGANQTYGFAGDICVQHIPFDTTQITSAANYSRPKAGDSCHPLAAGAHVPAVAFGLELSNQGSGGNVGWHSEDAPFQTLSTGGPPGVAIGSTVRRLSVTECHRLMGFPDGWCNVPWRGKSFAPDGPQYKALGNSKAVNVVRWVGRRIEMIERVLRQRRAA